MSTSFPHPQEIISPIRALGWRRHEYVRDAVTDIL
jgi:hypothetical protein